MGEAKRKKEESTLIGIRIVYHPHTKQYIQALLQERGAELKTASGVKADQVILNEDCYRVVFGSAHIDYDYETLRPKLGIPKMELFWELYVRTRPLVGHPYDYTGRFVTSEGALAIYLGVTTNRNNQVYANQTPRIWEICMEDFGAKLVYTNNDENRIIDPATGMHVTLHVIEDDEIGQLLYEAVSTVRTKELAPVQEEEVPEEKQVDVVADLAATVAGNAEPASVESPTPAESSPDSESQN